MNGVSAPLPQRGQRVLVITGKLAADQVRQVVGPLGHQLGIDFSIEVAGISVAALMHVDWLKRKVTVTEGIDHILLPGWVQGDVADLQNTWGLPCTLGPKEIRELPDFLGGKQRTVDLSGFTTEILAEVNHAPRKSPDELQREVDRYLEAGADVIDLGCVPGERWTSVGECVGRLVSWGVRVSIDSFDRYEVEAAVGAGAELVLSCSSENVDWAQHLDVEWVVIPDNPEQLESMWATAQQLRAAGRRVRVDPILSPVGFGFAASLARYFAVRAQDPHISIMMGVGNVTEMSEVDSAGVNFLLAAICAELQIGSVLTTEVIPWCQTAAKEFEIARRLAHYAVSQQAVPKRLGAGLVMLRDAKLYEQGQAQLDTLASQIRDPNFRLFAERGELHIINRDGYWRGTDPFELFDQFSKATQLDVSHAFYLGYELSKAVTALTLGKQYTQDEALNWGFLTRPEVAHRNGN